MKSLDFLSARTVRFRFLHLCLYAVVVSTLHCLSTTYRWEQLLLKSVTSYVAESRNTQNSANGSSSLPG